MKLKFFNGTFRSILKQGHLRVALSLGMALPAVVGLGSVTGCHDRPSPEQKASWVTSKISNQLKLDTDQKAKLEAVKQAFLENRLAHQPERAQTAARVRSLLLSPKLDPAEARALVTQRQKAVDQGFDAIFPKVAAFHASLSPEQKQKAVELFEKLASHWSDE